MPEETVGLTDTVSCDCDPCKRKRHEVHNVHDGTVHGYSATPPGGWTPRRNGADDATAPILGVELETTCPSRPYTPDLPNEPWVRPLPYGASDADVAERDAQRALHTTWRQRNTAHRQRIMARYEAQGFITATEAAAMTAPRGFWLPCSDSSVSGPEYKSLPATLAYWRHIRPALTGMYKALLHGGLRSHDGDTAGLHVNIGTDAFHARGTTAPDAGHLARFATLVCVNPRWATRMAMRTHDSMSHWANFDALDSDAKRRDWADQIARYGYASQPRYTALNAQNAGRIEFRLPRGTLRLDRFYAKLEWTASMVEYTRDSRNVVQVSAYVRWVQASGEYPELVRFLAERFPARLAVGA